MRIKSITPVLMAVVVVSAGLMLGVSSLSADSGGCPNANSENGAAHANPDNSAHGPDKQAARGCLTPAAELTPTPSPTPEPTPEPTPTATPDPTPEPTPTPAPTPQPQADVQVMSVFVNAPATSTAGVQFSFSASVGLRNNGTAPTVLVDTLFTPTAPADCTPVPGAVTVQDRWLPAGTNVSISRTWMVTCTLPGAHMFTMDGIVAIDPLQPAVDPNPANNSGSGNDTTQVN